MSNQYQIHEQYNNYKGYFFINNSRRYIHCSDERVDESENQTGNRCRWSYQNKRAKLMQNKGWISDIKYDGVLHILFMNPHRLRPNKVEKVNILKRSCTEKQIECCLFSSTDR